MIETVSVATEVSHVHPQTEIIKTINSGLLNCGKMENMTDPQDPWNSSSYYDPSYSTLPPKPRSKALAVLLVVLFGSFGFLYTYRLDKKIFYLGLSTSVLLSVLSLRYSVFELGSLALLIYFIYDRARLPKSYYQNYPNEMPRSLP